MLSLEVLYHFYYTLVEFNELHLISLSLKTDFKDKTTTVETTIQGIPTPTSVTANGSFTSDFLNIHQTTTGVFVKQTDISEWKTGKMTFGHCGMF